jgi:hypothetical protein
MYKYCDFIPDVITVNKCDPQNRIVLLNIDFNTLWIEYLVEWACFYQWNKPTNVSTIKHSDAYAVYQYGKWFMW